MIILGDELFKLTEESVKGLIYIKLNKKASYSEKGLNSITYNNKGEKSFIRFYSLGFYDSLICMKSEQLTSITHKEHFLISYPFEKTADTLNVEQWFGILPLSEPRRFGIGADSDELKDPFFCGDDLQRELPFIGVILLSLGNGASAKISDFKDLLSDFTQKCTGIFQNLTQASNRYIAQLYYSLNCADLCMVIRTDDLSFIHDMNYQFNVIAYDSGYYINSTVLFAIQYYTDNENYKRLVEKNNRVSFVVRSHEKFIEKCEKKNKDRSRGVNGVGKYVTILTYEEYIEFLPRLISYKFEKKEDKNDNDPLIKFAQSICHEREWFEEGDFQKHSFMCKESTEKLQTAICSWIVEVRDMIIKIEEFADNLFQYSRGFYKYREIFVREIRLIKDLIYAYSDLWYQDSSENGFVFFTQLMAALQGIDTLLHKIDIIVPSDPMVESSMEQLFQVMHCIACDFNGYNKQFLFLNQDSVNFPNYEIQSKVNAEKYMAAYCSFLHKFFVLYHQGRKDEQTVVQNLPLALVDLNQRKIIAHIFFSDLYRENTKRDNLKMRGIFAVHFPSSEYFSDLWNSIPLLMHEASHTHDYGEIIDRNRAVVSHIDRFFAEIIAREMIKTVNDGNMISTSSFLLERLKEIIFQVIYIQREEFFEKIGDFEKWEFQELRENCEEFFYGIFDKCVNAKGFTYNQFVKLKEKVKRDVEHIAQVLGFHEMCYPFLNDKSSLPTICYFINILYLEFNPEFYEEYQFQYDGSFLEDLKREICEYEDDIAEREILLLSLYRFFKYVKCDVTLMMNDIKRVVNVQVDSLIIAFTVVQMAAMRAIFEKYRHKFQNRISEERYCEQLVPNIASQNFSDFADILTDAYGGYVMEQEEERKPSMHDCSLMEALFCEYYEINLSINNVVRFLIRDFSSGGKFRNSNGVENRAEMFIESIHRECKRYICEEENKRGFKAIFTDSNREQLVRLGFFEEDDTILKKVFVNIFAGCDDKIVKDSIFDRVQLFKEVYADCGMCCAMGFDPFGYCMFALPVYDLVNDVNAEVDVKNFRADRVRAVVGMFFHDNEKMVWPKKLDEFLQKLCDVDMVIEICKMLQHIYDGREVDEIYHRVQKEDYKIKVECENDEAEIFQKDFKETLLRWRDDIIGDLLSVIEGKYEKEVIKDVIKRDKLLVAKKYLFHVHNIMKLFAVEDILSHIPQDMFGGFFQGIEGLMIRGKGIQAVRNDPCVMEISQFYNMDCPSDVDNKFEWYYSVYVKGFITQCNFVFDNYCEYRNAYNNIKRNVKVGENGEVNMKINQWFEVIDEYYRREGEVNGFKNS